MGVVIRQHQENPSTRTQIRWKSSCARDIFQRMLRSFKFSKRAKSPVGNIIFLFEPIGFGGGQSPETSNEATLRVKIQNNLPLLR